MLSHTPDYFIDIAHNLKKCRAYDRFMFFTLFDKVLVTSSNRTAKRFFRECRTYESIPKSRNVRLPYKRIVPHSTVILREYFKNIPLKSCNIARIFINLLEKYLKYCRNLAMSAQNIINVMLLRD